MYPNYNLGVFVALSGSLSSGISYLAIRKATTQINTCVNPVWFGISNNIYCFLGMMVGGEPFAASPIGGNAFVYLFLVGIFGWLADEGVSNGLRLEKAGRAAPILYL